MSLLKRLLKYCLRQILAVAGRHRWPLPGGQLLILTYHRVLPDGHPDLAWLQPGMRVSPQTLQAHIGWLRDAGFEVLSLRSWLEIRAAGAQLPRRACAITFDDGWADNFHHAFPVLTQAQTPATIFLVSDMVGRPTAFWPERLARELHSQHDNQALRDALQPHGITLPAGPVLGADAIDAVTVAVKSKLGDEAIEELLDQLGISGEVEAGLTPDLLDWDQVAEMQAGGLVEFGSHTRRHRRLTALDDPAERLDEVAGSARVLQQHLGQPATLFCYPNGDFDDSAVALVGEHYGGACTVARGWNGPVSNPLLLRRISMHEDVSDSRAAFLARLSVAI